MALWECLYETRVLLCISSVNRLWSWGRRQVTQMCTGPESRSSLRRAWPHRSSWMLWPDAIGWEYRMLCLCASASCYCRWVKFCVRYILHVRCTKWNVVYRSSSWADIKMKETFTHKSLFIGIGLQDIRMCLCYMCNYNFIYFECPKGTGAKPYSRPRTLASTGAKAPVAPVESAPMTTTAQFPLYNCKLHFTIAEIVISCTLKYALQSIIAFWRINCLLPFK